MNGSLFLFPLYSVPRLRFTVAIPVEMIKN